MAKKAPADYAMKYIGNGHFLDGVPTRDLTREEWEAVAEWRRELALKLNLYVLGSVEDAPKESE